MEREEIAVESNQIQRPHFHVAHKVARTDPTVVFGHDFERVDVGDLIRGHDHRAETEKRVDTLRAGEIAGILAEDIKRRQIERGSESINHFARLFRRYEAATSPDDNTQFALRVNLI